MLTWEAILAIPGLKTSIGLLQNRLKIIQKEEEPTWVTLIEFQPLVLVLVLKKEQIMTICYIEIKAFTTSTTFLRKAIWIQK